MQQAQPQQPRPPTGLSVHSLQGQQVTGQQPVGTMNSQADSKEMLIYRQQQMIEEQQKKIAELMHFQASSAKPTRSVVAVDDILNDLEMFDGVVHSTSGQNFGTNGRQESLHPTSSLDSILDDLGQLSAVGSSTKTGMLLSQDLC